MKWKPGGIVVLEGGEPFLRSCWECNEAHAHLRDRESLHTCLFCNRSWLKCIDFNDFKSDEDFDAAMEAAGIEKAS